MPKKRGKWFPEDQQNKIEAMLQLEAAEGASQGLEENRGGPEK